MERIGTPPTEDLAITIVAKRYYELMDSPETWDELDDGDQQLIINEVKELIALYFKVKTSLIKGTDDYGKYSV